VCAHRRGGAGGHPPGGRPDPLKTKALALGVPVYFLSARYSGRDVVWCHPAFANKCVFVRSDKEIVCVSLEG